MSIRRPRSEGDSRRLVKRLLIMLAIGGTLAAVLVGLVGATFYRQYRHKAAFLEKVEEVRDEEVQRDDLMDDARQRLLAGDFTALDTLVRSLRASREAFPNGQRKLHVVYRGLSAAPDGADDADWTRQIERSEEWAKARPDSIAARIVNAEIWLNYAFEGRGAGWAHELTQEQRAVYDERLDRVVARWAGAREVTEACPRRGVVDVRLGMSGRVSREQVEAAYARGVSEDPGDQALHSQYLRYLQPRWQGGPGELEKALIAVARAPGGPERVARALWWFEESDSLELGMAPWPVVKKGFMEMQTRYPDSLEVKSAACRFASYYEDREETQRLFAEIGHRMSPRVWRDAGRFAHAYHWAYFEETEAAGGDPLARVFRWIMGG
jgi:hypothetical protein